MSDSKDNSPKQQAHQPQTGASGGGSSGPLELGQHHTNHASAALMPDLEKVEFDEARFNAGVVKLYETIESEPIPDEMMALIIKLAKKGQA
jgi:hypothetical protein